MQRYSILQKGKTCASLSFGTQKCPGKHSRKAVPNSEPSGKSSTLSSVVSTVIVRDEVCKPLELIL